MFPDPSKLPVPKRSRASPQVLAIQSAIRADTIKTFLAWYSVQTTTICHTESKDTTKSVAQVWSVTNLRLALKHFCACWDVKQPLYLHSPLKVIEILQGHGIRLVQAHDSEELYMPDVLLDYPFTLG